MATQKNRIRNRYKSDLFKKRLPPQLKNLLLTLLVLVPVSIFLLYTISQTDLERERFFPEINATGDPDSVYYNIRLAYSYDAINWIKYNTSIAKHAIMPAAVIVPGKGIVLYATFKNYPYSDFPTVVGFSEDGYTFDWYETGFMSDDGTPRPFSIGHEISGKFEVDSYRVYYVDYYGDDIPIILTSQSEDGILFENEIITLCQNPLNFTSYMTPSIDVVENDGIWFMFISKDDQIYVAESNNGINFWFIEEKPILNGSMSSTIFDDNVYRIFYSRGDDGISGIHSAFSIDGYNWTEEVPSILPESDMRVYDPSIIKVNDSFWIMYYVAEENPSTETVI